MSEQAFWYFEPCAAERVTITVADMPENPGYWVREQGLVGTDRPAVRVTYRESTFYLDDEFGKGWRKVTEEQGSPQAAHAELHPVEGSVRPREA